MTRLKATLKALSEPYPSSEATDDIVRSLFIRICLAECIRKLNRYLAGVVPVACLNLSEKADRDSPALSASSPTFQFRVTSSWIRVSAAATCSSGTRGDRPLTVSSVPVLR
jgi:hypothetical protein